MRPYDIVKMGIQILEVEASIVVRSSGYVSLDKATTFLSLSFLHVQYTKKKKEQKTFPALGI